MAHPLDKLAEFDVQQLLSPHDAGNTAAKITGGVLGAGTGSALTNIVGTRLLKRIGGIQSPKLKALAAILTAVGGVATMAGGAAAGVTAGDRIRPEKSRWTLALKR